MKNKFSLLILLSFVSLSTFAQEFKGGMTAGVVVSQIAGDGLSGFDKIGLNGGFFVNYLIAGNSGLQMDLNYVQKGSARGESAENPAETQYLLRLNYIELPLVYQYHWNQWVFEGGFSVDFLVSDYEEINYIQNDQGDIWRKAPFNSVFGVKYFISEHWIASLRTVNSINSIRTNTVPLNVRRYSLNYGAYSDVLAFTLSYQF